MAFLDETGVQYLWNKIKTVFAKNEDAVHKTGEETITGTKTFNTGMLGKLVVVEPVEGVIEILPKNGTVYLPIFPDASDISIKFRPFEEIVDGDDSVPYPTGIACVTLVLLLPSVPANIAWSSDSNEILWEEGTPPDLEGECVLTFITHDSGNSWIGCVNAINVSPASEND